ncbi:hypothetical protein F5888DRAFT_1945748 [Russula emetica]|nr:hypothetical protein F5888DRAFT_1945748 [Russula emetica]
MDISPKDLSRVCKRFRVLIIGRRNAGKTTILEKMTGSDEGAKPEIRDKEGHLVDDPTLVKAGLERGMSMIDYEITYPSSPRFVFHDSRGIEAGAESDCHEYIQKFINDRAGQRRLGDQLHAIWFCMPMDTPRVPSNEFELAFLEEVNHNVPVIAVLTKYEALVDRVKGKYKGRQVTNSDILNYAKMNVYDPLKNVTHVPAAIIQTHHKGKGCELLTKKTFEAINDETLATIFAMAQQNSIKLACQQIFKFKDNIAQSTLLKLKMATKTNDIALYEHFIDMSLRFLPFWNMIVSYYLCLLLLFNTTHIIFILISLLVCKLPFMLAASI